jgi:hypothetical protein
VPEGLQLGLAAVDTWEIRRGHLRRNSCGGHAVAGPGPGAQEYVAVLIDQAFLETEPVESDMVLEHIGTAIPVHVNFAISGMDRVVRDLRAALHRHKREDLLVRQEVQQALRNELKDTVYCYPALLRNGTASSQPAGRRGNQDAFCMRTGAGGTRRARWRLTGKPPRR